jgi:hypothetical protein
MLSKRSLLKCFGRCDCSELSALLQSVKPSDLVCIVVVWFSVVVGQAVSAARVSSCSVDRMWSGSGFAGDVQAEVAPGFGPFVVLICQRGADEADRCFGLADGAKTNSCQWDVISGLRSSIWPPSSAEFFGL